MPADQEARPKPVNYRKIAETNEAGQRTRWYVEMDRLIAAHHPGLVEFKIALLWRKGWKPDKDGRLILGQAVKASPDASQFHGIHGYIRLNEEYFHDPETPEEHKIAILDHELCHFDREVDKEGDTRMDEDGQPLIRMKKHDVEEFECIIDRHGLYTDRLRTVAGTMHNARERERRGTTTPVAGGTAAVAPQENEDFFEEET